MARLEITPSLFIDERELIEDFILGSGPGGQNVNKVATAVQLRFNAGQSPALDESMRARLTRLAGRRMTKDGVIVITARRFRTQEQNRADARERLVALLTDAAKVPVQRRATKPSYTAKKKRIETKKARGGLKRLRGKPSYD
jgi:ribosome-associated protein